MREHNAMSDATAPHCNPEVLHPPGTCWACDLFPDRQQARIAGNTPFTSAGANGWPGNVAQPSARRTPPDRSWIEFEERPSLRQRLRKAMGL